MTRRVAGEVPMVPPECVPGLPPCNMRLAEAYVLYQIYTAAFDPAQALCAGTVFPELYKPYVISSGGGMCPWR